MGDGRRPAAPTRGTTTASTGWGTPRRRSTGASGCGGAYDPGRSRSTSTARRPRSRDASPTRRPPRRSRGSALPPSWPPGCSAGRGTGGGAPRAGGALARRPRRWRSWSGRAEWAATPTAAATRCSGSLPLVALVTAVRGAGAGRAAAPGWSSPLASVASLSGWALLRFQVLAQAGAPRPTCRSRSTAPPWPLALGVSVGGRLPRRHERRPRPPRARRTTSPASTPGLRASRCA